MHVKGYSAMPQTTVSLFAKEANISNASSHVDDTINKLQALKVIKIPVSVVVNSDDECGDNEIKRWRFWRTC